MSSPDEPDVAPPAEPGAEPPARPTDPPADPDRRESAWERKRRLAAVFGDVLPETTNDERDRDTRGASDESSSEEWLRRQVPPHHG